MLIEKYGVPDFVSVGPDLQTMEIHFTCNAALVYDEPYIIIRFGEQEGNAIHLAPTTLIEPIGYSDPGFPF